MVKILDQEIFLSFYGDDFTGSTDVMESLTMSGIPTALFLAPPSLEEIQAFRLKNPLSNIQGKGIQAYGVAGVSRIMNPTQMDQELPGIFKAIQKIPTNFGNLNKNQLSVRLQTPSRPQILRSGA